jgi:TolB protein
VAALAVAAMMAAGCSTTGSTTAVTASGTASPNPTTSAAAPTTPAVANGVEAAIADVPWAKVGPGWMLAMWSPVTPHQPGVPPAPGEADPATASTTLHLVDPMGNRYPITTFPPGDNSDVGVVDWSGDGSHALVGAKYGEPTTVISVDLHTGAQTTIPVTGNVGYTRPDGKAILVSTGANASGNGPAATLKRIDLAGKEQLTYPTDKLGDAGQFKGGYLESSDGTQLVLSGAKGLVVMGNDGKVVRQLPSPLSNGECGVVRWWTPTVVLANCTAAEFAGTQLWEIPLDGSTATALTALNTGQQDSGFGGDYGDGIAWQLPSGTFLQSAGACGTEFLSRLTPDMHTTRIDVPGVSRSVHVAGVSGDDLVLLAKVGCGGTTSLLTYDPATNTSTVLLGPPINGGGVSDAVLFPERS